MKKVLILIISLFYLLSAIGAPYVEHHCMGENLGISLSNEQWVKCPKCGMKNNANKGCCKDVHKTIKASEQQKTSSVQLYLAVAQALVPAASQQYPSTYFAPENKEAAGQPSIKAPPNIFRHCPYFVEIRNLRI